MAEGGLVKKWRPIHSVPEVSAVRSAVIKVKKDILEKTEICAETYRLRFRPSILEDD